LSLFLSLSVCRVKSGEERNQAIRPRESIFPSLDRRSHFTMKILCSRPPPLPFGFSIRQKTIYCFGYKKKTFWLEKQEKILQRLTAISSGKLSCFSPYPSYFLIPSFLVLTSQEQILYTSSFPDSFISCICVRTLGLYL